MVLNGLAFWHHIFFQRMWNSNNVSMTRMTIDIECLVPLVAWRMPFSPTNFTRGPEQLLLYQVGGLSFFNFSQNYHQPISNIMPNLAIICLWLSSRPFKAIKAFIISTVPRFSSALQETSDTVAVKLRGSKFALFRFENFNSILLDCLPHLLFLINIYLLFITRL